MAQLHQDASEGGSDVLEIELHHFQHGATHAKVSKDAQKVASGGRDKGIRGARRSERDRGNRLSLPQDWRHAVAIIAHCLSFATGREDSNPHLHSRTLSCIEPMKFF